MALALEYVRQNPTVTTNTVQFQSLGLDDTQLKNLAYQLIETSTFVGKWITVYTSRGPRNTSPVEANQVAGIARYLKAFIDVDRSPLEDYFDNYNAADAQRTFICEVIDRRDDMLTITSVTSYNEVWSKYFMRKSFSKFIAQPMPLLLFPLPPLSPLPHPLDETVLYVARYANQCSHHIGEVVHSGLV